MDQQAKLKPAGHASRVLDDWPENIPINDDELRLIEAHLGDIIATIIGNR